MLVKRLKTAVFFTMMVFAQVGAQAQTPVDWTPVFTGFENGCGDNKLFDTAFWDSAIRFNTQKEVYELGKVRIGQPYLGALGKPRLKTDGMIGYYYFPISGTYRGIPIKGLDISLQYQGGYSYLLRFDASATEVKQKLNGVRFKPSGYGRKAYSGKGTALECGD